MADLPPAPESSSVLIYGGTVLSLDADRPILRQGELLVQRGVVASMGKSLTLMPGTRLLDVTGHVVIPGLVETGTRLGLQVIADLDGPDADAESDDAELEAAMDDESAHACALYGAVKALLAGVTTIQDDGLAAGERGLARALGESGLRVAAAGADSRDGDGRSRGLGLPALRGRDDARSALTGATLEAAESLGLGAELGSVGVGKWADLVILAVDRDELESTPDDHLFELALSPQAEVRHVLVAGSQVVRDGLIVHHDLGALESAAREQVVALRARAQG